ncbi:MAG: signal peptide peptidase SppA [Firmicutes bacterium HGW-Firmicutes-15]|nr:MAG: signal peptide peptidase SppA [Firmicutes bacterium HGW-Firmicutes-15]
MNKKRWWALAIFTVLLVVWAVSSTKVKQIESTGTSSYLSYLNRIENKQSWTTQIYREGKGKILALVKLEGEITETPANSPTVSSGYNHQVFLKQLEAAFSREDIKGVIMQVNSPGGGVYESDEIYNRILELKAKYKKPLVVYMSQEAASGGYYVSMAADKIYANRNTLTGSIGVIIRTYNYQELADKIGVKDVTFKSGAQKDLLNPMRPLNDQEKAIAQSLVNESYGYFVDIVAKGRKMDRNQVLQLADGRVYSGTQAKNLGLVDELGNLDQAISGTAELANITDPQVLLFENPGPDLLSWFTSMNAPAFDLLGLKQQVDQALSPQIMYIAN